MLGVNVIGKIYKSKNLKTLNNGFEIETKLKSNFGGIKDLIIKVVVRNGFVEIRLNHNILLNIKDLNQNAIFQNGDYVLLNIFSDFRVEKILRPDSYNFKKNFIKLNENKSIKNGIYIPLAVYTRLDCFKIVDLYLTPSVYENKEYIEIIIKNMEDVRFCVNK